MNMLVPLAWRCLVLASLVLNPVAADAAAQRANGVAGASQELAPCHQMANESAAPAKPAPAAPDKHHGDCDNTICQFAACCALGALDTPKPLLASLAFPGAQALPLLDLRRASAPPAARLIRPPIA